MELIWSGWELNPRDLVDRDGMTLERPPPGIGTSIARYTNLESATYLG